MSDEELQKLFDSNQQPEANGGDVTAYRKVFKAISKEPSLKIGSGFAESVVKRIVAKKKREARRDFIWLSFGVVFLVIGLIVTAAVAGLQFDFGFLNDMSGYAGIFTFAIVVILVFNVIERKLLFKNV